MGLSSKPNTDYQRPLCYVPGCSRFRAHNDRPYHASTLIVCGYHNSLFDASDEPFELWIDEPLACVYILRCQDTQYYKVGMSKATQIRSRLKSLQCGCPHKHQLVAVCVYRSFRLASLAESDAHFRLQQFNYRGEWYELSKEQLSTFYKAIVCNKENPICRASREPVGIEVLLLDTEREWYAVCEEPKRNLTPNEIVYS